MIAEGKENLERKGEDEDDFSLGTNQNDFSKCSLWKRAQSPGACYTYTEKWIHMVQRVDCGRHRDTVLRSLLKKGLIALL